MLFDYFIKYTGLWHELMEEIGNLFDSSLVNNRDMGVFAGQIILFNSHSS